MIELILGTYGFLCWLVFKKWKLVPLNAYSVGTAILGGVGILIFIYIILQMFHPATSDARFYAYTTQVVSQVRGMVIEVPVEPNAPLKKGDVLFRIDPTPYEFEVDRLEAMLANTNTTVSQLEKKLRAAEAKKSSAEANVLTAESTYDRQVRETVAQAKDGVVRAKANFELAEIEKTRSEELVKTGALAQQTLDQANRAYEAANAAVRQSESALREAEENLSAATPKLKSVREDLENAQAQEDEARIAFEAETEGQNPQVRQIAAELSNARWELEQTTVRAPADGYATHVTLRPGQMATALGLLPLMVFVHAEAQVLVASFKQNVLANLEAGNEAELILDAYPGDVYPAKLKRIIPAIAEGQVIASGTLQTTASATAASRVLVTFEYDDTVTALGLPAGASGTIAVYTEHWHPLSILRKIVLRIQSWENYLFLP